MVKGNNCTVCDVLGGEKAQARKEQRSVIQWRKASRERRYRNWGILTIMGGDESKTLRKRKERKIVEPGDDHTKEEVIEY